MTSQFNLINPRTFALKLAKAAGLGAATALIPFGLALTTPQFEPPEVIGFPSASLGDNLLSVVQTGDLLFFNQPQFLPKPIKWFYSTLQKTANFSDYEHIGVIVWNSKKQYPYVVEKTLFGTIVTPFEDRIGWSQSQDVLLRSFHLFRPPEFQQTAQQFVEDEIRTNDPSQEGVLTKGMRWALLLRSLTGSWVRDYNVPKSKHGITSHQLQSMEEIMNLQYSKNPFEREQYQKLVGSTSKKGEVQRHEQVPVNRVIQYAEIVGTLKLLRHTEQDLTKHLTAENARKQYEMQLHQFQTKSLVSSPKSSSSSLSSALDELDGGSNAITTNTLNTNSEPTKPLNLDQELGKKDLLQLLQKREFLYEDFEKKYDTYRKDTVFLSRFGIYRPLNDDSYPAFPSADMIARMFQKLNLLPKPFHPKISPIDVEHLFPPSFPGLEENERKGQFDCRKFDFAKAFETVSEFCPTSLEYKPYNFRKQNPMFISQGLFGDEQHVIQRFNKPPIEYRTGILSTPEHSKR